jgi:hypothetical protein
MPAKGFERHSDITPYRSAIATAISYNKVLLMVITPRPLPRYTLPHKHWF